MPRLLDERVIVHLSEDVPVEPVSQTVREWYDIHVGPLVPTSARAGLGVMTTSMVPPPRGIILLQYMLPEQFVNVPSIEFDIPVLFTPGAAPYTENHTPPEPKRQALPIGKRAIDV